MDKDKFTNIYRLPGSIQIRIGKWQKTFSNVKASNLHGKELKLSSSTQNEDIFTLTTTGSPEKDVMFKYSFSFSWIDGNGDKKFATIDLNLLNYYLYKLF